MRDLRPLPAEPVDQPMFWESSLAFLKYSIACILVGFTAFLIALHIFAQDWTVRDLAVIGFMLAAGGAWFLLSRHRIRATIVTLAVAAWVYVTVVSVLFEGASGASILIYPVIILLVGWLFDPRAGVAVAVLTTAATGGFALAELWGFLPAPVPTPSGAVWVVQCCVFIISAVLMMQLVRSYRNRLEEVRKLSSDLALRTAEVQAREADLNRAQAVAHVGSWVYDLAADVMRLSAETCRIFGLPEGTTGSRETYLSRAHPEDRNAVDSAWQAALKEGEPFDYVHRILVRKTIRWVRQRAELEFGADGTPLRSLGTTQDITERKWAEEALRASEQRFRSVIELAPLGIAFSRDGITLGANPVHLRMFGYEHIAELSGSPLLERIAPQCRVEMADRLKRRALGQAVETTYETIGLRKDGSQFPFMVSTSRIALPDGPMTIAFIVDITERKQVEAALKQSEQRLRAIVETEPECVKVLGRDGQLLEMNVAGLAMLEAESVAEVQRHALPNFLLPGYRAAFGALHERVMRGESGMLEFEVVGLKGTRRWLETHAAPMRDATGEVAMLLGIARDITERKRVEAEHAQLEAQLRESQKMEALGTLAGGVAHDFNNIVAAIMGNVELARQDVGPRHAALESLEEIRKAGRRAKDLVQQILAFGRRQVFERQLIPLAPVVEESVRLLRSTLPAGVSVSVECAPDAPLVQADATQVQQVLLNLCANAWQAMQGQKRPAAIAVSLAPYLANGAPYMGPERRSSGGRIALRPGRYACLTVRDTGPGMDQTTRSRIFEPFFTTKPVGKGTGLGLAVVHGIVQDHGASIAVHSAPGEGAAFRIYFPAVQAPAAVAPWPLVELKQEPSAARKENGEAPVLQGEGKSILYVDDDEAIVFLMTRLLEREGYRVTGCTDQREALAAVRSRPEAFDLVVTDYNMPGLTGLDLARALRDIRADLPVALASGYITEELRAEAPAAGVIELVYKPNTVDELCGVIARLAHGLPI
ncbi:MAG: PAS domain S-box protein [Betaproteobacteria bacterium]|nr:PAS domain S-box protein [Betaproteobacteria bacterium]